ncbi:MAG TPA: contractile injection system protein, VgrG/Pvc8 family, partial [Bacteroidia bacterium]|nr:contractile injection system protein, VgrG/Pvc8 family [Bacteroidia bacterium]
MKKIIINFIFSSLISTCFAQNAVVIGMLNDSKDNTPLIGATAILLQTNDSAIYKGNTADMNGKFIIPNVAKGNYIFKASYLGYNDHFMNVKVIGDTLKLPSISLQQSSKLLNDVVVNSKAPTAVQKGDTTQYNANSYKANPDANAEDLITKMPGITSQNGTVQAHGEDVKKVLVDGKPFFGDDVNAVLKNLPADVIDKIQVFDQQSDQSQFTGVNDGNTTKALNIITKPGMKNGTFLPADAFELQLASSYAPREYVTQWKESELDFLLRWLEELGIHFYFEHGPDGHVMVLSDRGDAHDPIAGNDTLTVSDFDWDVDERDGLRDVVFSQRAGFE